MAQDELQPYRQQFARVNTADPVSLRRWFDTHPYISNRMMARLAGVDVAVIRDWRDRAGLPRGKQRIAKPPRQLRVITLSPPPGRWTDPDWLIPAYNLTHSPKTIGDLVGVTKETVNTVLNKLGVPKLGKLKHHCDNRRWVEENYVKQAASLNDCARRAGVSRDTITNWVLKYGFQIRSGDQALRAKRWQGKGAGHLWVQELAHKLSAHPAIRSVQLSDRGLVVKYRYTLREEYRWELPRALHSQRIFPIDPEGAQLRQEPPIHEQYPGEEFDSSPYPHHLIINPQDWERASFVERRLALHGFMRELRSHHLPVYPYPQAVLQESWARLREQNARAFLYRDVLRLAPRVHIIIMPGHW